MRETAFERRLRNAVRDERAVADGAQNDALQLHRQNALAYFRCEPRGDEVDDRSQVISPDLNAAVTANLALMRSMLIEDGSVTVQKDGPDDEISALCETEILRRVIYDDNQGEVCLMHAIQDGLLSGTSILCIDAEETQSDDPETPFVRFNIRAVPSENVSFEAAYDGNLQDIRFFAERKYYSRSDLIEMGVSKKKADKLNTGSDYNTRDMPKGKSRKDQAAEPEQDTIETYWNYIRLDDDGDGVSELYRVLTGTNDEVLLHEPVSTIPYAMGVPFINPHRLVGESLYDKVKMVQDVGTSFMRGLIDNVNLMNVGRLVYDPSRVSEDDIMNPVAGGGIRARDPSAIMPLPVPDSQSGILAGLEFIKRKRTEVAGAAIDMASAEAQMMHKTATAASIDKSNSELVASLIARTLALTLIMPLHKLLHRMIREHGVQPFFLTVRGQQKTVIPQDLRPNRKFSLHVGKPPSEKAQETMALQQHLAMQVQAMQAGMNGVLADADTLYKTSLRLLQLAKVEEPECFMIDPASPQAQQAAEQQAQQAQQQQQQQAQMMQQQIRMAETQIAEQSRQHDDEMRHKYYDTDMDAAIAEAKIVGQGQIDIEKARITKANGTGTNQGTAE